VYQEKPYAYIGGRGEEAFKREKKNPIETPRHTLRDGGNKKMQETASTGGEG